MGRGGAEMYSSTCTPALTTTVVSPSMHHCDWTNSHWDSKSYFWTQPVVFHCRKTRTLFWLHILAHDNICSQKKGAAHTLCVGDSIHNYLWKSQVNPRELFSGKTQLPQFTQRLFSFFCLKKITLDDDDFHCVRSQQIVLSGFNCESIGTGSTEPA